MERDHETTALQGHTLAICPARVALALSIVVALLLTMHGTVMYAKYGLGYDTLVGLVRMFDLLSEGNVPTWYSSIALLACAIVLATLGYVTALESDRLKWYWLGLAAVFVLLSMDEAAGIHETVQAFIRRGVDVGSTYYGVASIMYPTGLVLVVLTLTLPLLVALPKRTAILFLTAGAAFVAGAIGVDYVGDLHKNVHGTDNATFAFMNLCEEGLEMSAVVVFLYALLDYLRRRTCRLSIAISARRQSADAAPRARPGN